MDAASTSGKGTEGPARWSLRLLGGFELGVLSTGEKLALPGKRERVLLAYLALSPNSRQPRRKLATLLWGDGDDETALDNLRTTIWRLRKALGDSEHRIVASDGEDIVLDTAAFEADALTLHRLAAQLGQTELELAANLYSGELLYGLEIENDEFESWRRTQAARCREQAIDVLTRLMTHSANCGDSERAIEAGTRILQLDPLNEAAVRRLMRLYGRSGRRGAAVQLYRTLAEALRADLNAQPEAETRSVYAEIARGGEERTGGPPGGDFRPLPPASTLARPSDVSGALGQTKVRMRSWIAASGLAAMIALFLLYQVAPWSGRATGSPVAGDVSIAVLPFVNLSGDDGQEFLSDGMTEEITAALAKVPGLRVVARTSAFQFKSQNRDIQVIARQLHASHIIEGSVRRAGDRLRVTAQLIEASGGTHLWSESYDRQLTDILGIQEDIARTIAVSLRVPLGSNSGENLVNRNIDPESYQLYLRAKALWDARGMANLTDGGRMLEQVVARNPNYAPAWAVLCATYFLKTTPLISDDPGPVDALRGTVSELLEKADAACRQAIALDPNYSLAYGASGTLIWSRGDPLKGEELFLKALALDPNDADSTQGYGIRLAIAGRQKEALAMAMKAHALEPFAPQQALDAANDLWFNGRTDEAIALAKTLRPIDRAPALARIYASQGRFGEAADSLAEISASDLNSDLVHEAIRLLRMAPAHVASPQSLPRLPLSLDFVYLYVGAPDRILENLERKIDAGYFTGTQVGAVWLPDYHPVRKTERFRTVMLRAGYVDYWNAKGWPELCRPTTADDFACD